MDCDGERIWEVGEHLVELWSRDVGTFLTIIMAIGQWPILCRHVPSNILLMQMYDEPCIMCSSVYKCTFIANKASCHICKQPLHIVYDVVRNISAAVPTIYHFVALSQGKLVQEP